MGTLRQNNGGFTLVEVMMAMLITIVGLFGLLQSINLATAYNLKNQLRDEAVSVAEERMGFLKARPFDDVSTSSSRQNSRIRSAQQGYYQVVTTVKPWNGDFGITKRITVDVSWNYKNEPYSHQVTSIRSQSQ